MFKLFNKLTTLFHLNHKDLKDDISCKGEAEVKNLRIYRNNRLLKRKSRSVEKSFFKTENQLVNNFSNKELPLVRDSTFTKSEWTTIISSEIVPIDENRLKLSLRKGIPLLLRGRIWTFLSKAKFGMNENAELFDKFLIISNESVEKYIETDLNRMNLDHLTQTEKLKIFNILKVYSLLDFDVGYSQGSGFFVYLILSQVKSQFDSFWIFHTIMVKNKWREVYIEGNPKIKILINKLIINLKKKLPQLHNHLTEIQVLPLIEGIFSIHFLSFFTYHSDFHYAVRILDLYFVLGEMVLIDCLIILLKLQERKLIKMEMDELIPYLSKSLVKDCLELYGIDSCLPDVKV